MKRESGPDGRAPMSARAKRSWSRRRAVLGAPVLLALLLAPGAGRAFADGNANFLIGTRHLADNNFWWSDNQTVAGVMVDFGRAGWPIHLSLASMSSSHSPDWGTESIDEYSVGVMKVWEPKSAIRPFVGAGIAAVRASVTFDQSGGHLVRDDTSPGGYVDAGVFWRTGRRFNIGFGARLMTLTSVEFQSARGDSGNANYLQLHILAGWGWPRRERRLPASPPAEAP